LLGAEKAAVTNEKGQSMVKLLDKIRADKKFSTAAQWEDANKIRDGILVRDPEGMIKYGSQWKVAPNALMEKTAEMTNAAGKSQRTFPVLANGYSDRVQSTTPEARSILRNR